MPFSQYLIYAGLVVGVALLINALISFLMMELAIDHKAGRTKEGMLQIKPRGFVIRYLYRLNIMNSTHCLEANIPKDICQLFFGIFNFWIISCIFGAFVCLIVLFVAMVWFLYALFMTFFGRLPEKVKITFYPSKFHPYQRFGAENQKKWVAPWKIILLFSVILGLSFFGETKLFIQQNLNTIHYTGFGIYLAIVAAGTIWFLIVLFQVLKPVFSGYLKATSQLIEGWKEKKCIRIANPDKVKIEGQSIAMA